MKLTLQIKLLPSKEQGIQLLETIRKANAACTYISDFARPERPALLAQGSLRTQAVCGIPEARKAGREAKVNDKSRSRHGGKLVINPG